MSDRPSAAKERADLIEALRRARAAVLVVAKHGLEAEYLDAYRELQPKVDACDGSGECAAPIHIHGCYSDDGTNCDHPNEHPPAVAADRLLDPAPGDKLCGLHQWPGDEGPCAVCAEMTDPPPVSAAVSPAEPPEGHLAINPDPFRTRAAAMLNDENPKTRALAEVAVLLCDRYDELRAVFGVKPGEIVRWPGA